MLPTKEHQINHQLFNLYLKHVQLGLTFFKAIIRIRAHTGVNLAFVLKFDCSEIEMLTMEMLF